MPIGLDLGGTDLKAVHVSPAGELLSFTRVPSRALDSRDGPYEAAVEALAIFGASGREALESGLGFGCPGVIDSETGELRGTTPHLLHWRDEPVRAELERRFGCRAVVDNDANLAALAEARLGAGRGSRVLMLVTLGTGIGCGLVIDGRIQRGAWGGAGELGHVPLGSGSMPCACGVPNCVEPEASASGLVRAARARGLECASAADVFSAAAGGNAFAVELIARFHDRLGATLATAVAILDPDVLLVGGGVAEAGDALMTPLRASFERYARPGHRERLRFERASLGERAGAIGAALLALDAGVPTRSEPAQGRASAR